MTKTAIWVTVVSLLVLVAAAIPRLASAREGPLKALNEEWLRGFQQDLSSAEEVLRGKDASE